MEWWTIGRFASASNLSPKALRLYDELGLLPPARVDPVTGYRLYAPDQLERARLVAWLRRLGMPLPRIRAVCGLDPGVVAGEVAAFWAQVEAETDARRELAAVLIGRLGGVAPGGGGGLRIRYAVGSEVGLVRATNQDVAHADPHLLAVADGFGDRGAPVGSDVVRALADLAAGDRWRAGDLLGALQDAVRGANEAIARRAAGEGPGGPGVGPGTTLTALLWTGSALALVHIGDSRAYLARDGGFFQLTQDHSLVQAMVDDGRLTVAEAVSHPQRALLLRALDGAPESRPDVQVREPRPGDRYVLCSDGVSGVLPAGELCRLADPGVPPADAVAGLLAAVRRAGAPDNASCVVADVTDRVAGVSR